MAASKRTTHSFTPSLASTLHRTSRFSSEIGTFAVAGLILIELVPPAGATLAAWGGT